MFNIERPWVFVFGILGNLISFLVFLAPISTFYRIYKKKSTEEFQSVPYVVALFSSMLWMYYGFLTNGWPLLTINTIGCVIQSIYIIIFLIYAPKRAKIMTAKLLFLLNLGLFSSIVLSTFFLAQGENRVRILGWVCVVLSTCVFAAPLSVMRMVVRTKSVEYMPFWLSFFLMLTAVIWFTYGLLLKDIYIAIPNVLGFVFGILQIGLYVMYKDHKGDRREEKSPEQNLDVVLSTIVNSEVHTVDIKVPSNRSEDHKAHEPTHEKSAYPLNQVQKSECAV